MNVLIAPDSMKDALSAREAAALMKKAVEEVFPEATVSLCPFSDGGEGLIDVLLFAGVGKIHEVWVQDPLKRKVRAELMQLDEHTFVVEMAQASGLERLSLAERNPLYTTTYGTGELIRYALQKGARRIFLGMGGSATHDLGCGMAQALGVRFLDQDHRPVDPVGAHLSDIVHIDDSGLLPLEEVEFYGISDVTNPLLGATGAAAVYAAQKGADRTAVNVLEEGSRHVASLVERRTGTSTARESGTGAAGGLGFGLVTFLNGKVLRGVEVLSDLFSLEKRIAMSDLVLTLEGKTDLQTLHGKAPYFVGKQARTLGKTVIHFTGSWSNEGHADFNEAFDVVVPIQDHPMDTQESIFRVRELLTHAVTRSFRLIKIGQLI